MIIFQCPTCDNSQSIDLSNGAYKALGGTVDEGVFPSKLTVPLSPVLC